MTREQLDKSLKECQHRLVTEVPVHEQSATTRLQRVVRRFGQFLREQRDIQHNFDLCHAQALTLMQSIIPKHAASV